MNLTFKNFNVLSENDDTNILAIRNSDYIRFNMKSTDLIKLDNHLIWRKRLKEDNLNTYYAVFDGDIIVGAIYITEIDYKKKECTWGLYFKKKINPFISTNSVYLIIEKIFTELSIHELKLEVNKLNAAAYKFDLSFGFEMYDESDKELYKMKMSSIKWDEIKKNKLMQMIKRKIDKINYIFIEEK